MDKAESTENIEYDLSARKMRDSLNSVSKSFCLAKWKMVSLHLTNGRTQSCYHPPAHQVPVEGLEQNPGLLHNTEIKINERAQMRQGERPSGCSYCWAVEDAPAQDKLGHLSDRHYRSSEWWVGKDFENIKNGDAAFDKNVTPAYLEVNFNQACNFKCIYCSPHLSSEWHKEVKQHGSFLLDGYAHNEIPALEQSGLMPLAVPNEENPYVKAFWKWWPQVYPNLKIFRMTGGEPLVDHNTWKVLEYAQLHPNADLELSITSNLCPPKPEIFEKFIRQLQKLESVQIWEDKEKFNINSGNHWYVSPAIKYFMLYVSCDSVGVQAEYIRTGMNYRLLKKNAREFLKNTSGTSISFINTFNILSLPKLKDFLKFILEMREEFSYQNQQDLVVEVPDRDGFKHPPYVRKKRQRVWFDIPMLTHPNWLNIKLLAGTKWEQHLEECIRFMEENVQKDDYITSYTGFKPYEILKLKRNLAVINKGFSEEEKSTHEMRFVHYVNELDRRRATNFKDTFPEFADYYDEICVKIRAFEERREREKQIAALKQPKAER